MINHQGARSAGAARAQAASQAPALCTKALLGSALPQSLFSTKRKSFHRAKDENEIRPRGAPGQATTRCAGARNSVARMVCSAAARDLAHRRMRPARSPFGKKLTAQKHDLPLLCFQVQAVALMVCSVAARGQALRRLSADKGQGPEATLVRSGGHLGKV